MENIPAAESPAGLQTPQAQAPERKKARRRTVIKVVIWAAIIALIAFLTLFLSSRIGQFGSIGDMLAYIRAQF